METFTRLKPFVPNPGFPEQRERELKIMNINNLDKPIRGLIQDLLKLPFCFTLQSCYGHFMHQKDESYTNVESISLSKGIEQVKYRIAYIAFCMQNNEAGEQFLAELKTMEAINPDYIQVGCAQWFWDRQPNSYVIQVEPVRYQTKDQIYLDYPEALKVERVRNKAFNLLKNMVIKKLNLPQDNN